jgi:murein DD-endopeptidase MepM/ murein hydrolase activator NlpD
MILRKLSTFVLITILLLFLNGSMTLAQNTRGELQFKLTTINDEIDKAKKEFNNLEVQKKDLNEQVSATKLEISKIEKLIADTQLVILDLGVKIPITQGKIKSLEDQVYILYKEIQYYSVTSKAELILTSKNFADMVSKLYGISEIQTEAEKVSGELKDNLSLLEEQKKAQEALLLKQKDTKFILNSKKSNLDQLIISTENKQSEYDKKIKEQEDNAKKVKSDLAALPQDVQNYIYANGGNTSIRGDDNSPCYFYEYRKLNYPDGYFINPTQGAFTDNFSCYPWSWDWRKNGHDGLDIANSSNTPIYATADGVAVKYHYDFGNSIVLRHDLPSGQTVYSMYGHMNSPSPIKIGQFVKQGQVIGYMGATGFVTGVHLHFMIISDTYERFGPYCSYGNRQAKCYNPAKILGW